MQRAFYIMCFSLIFQVPVLLNAQSDSIIRNFVLPSTSGESVSLGSFHSKKAVVVIFSGNHCVYSKKYEDRIISLAVEFAPQNVQLIMINSNNPDFSEDDRMEVMKARAIDKQYSFPYLQDSLGVVAKMFGANKNPEAFVLAPATDGSFTSIYQGKFDDNPLLADKVQEKYVSQAIQHILSGKKEVLPTQDVIGCGIKGLE